MKKYLPILCAISLLFNAGFLAGLCQRGCSPDRSTRGFGNLLGGPGGLSSRRVVLLADTLAMTPEQITRLTAVSERFQGERQSLFSAFQESRSALNAALFTSKPDPAAIEAARAVSPMPKMQDLMIAERLAINEILTEEQRVKLLAHEKEAASAWMERTAEKRQ